MSAFDPRAERTTHPFKAIWASYRKMFLLMKHISHAQSTNTRPDEE